MGAGLHELDAAEAAARIADGRMTSRALVSACLDRIAERDGELRAWTHVEPAHALGQACMSDAAGPGPLRGIPVGIKDIFRYRRPAHGLRIADPPRAPPDA